jgi:hypothetical protein
LDPDHPSTSLTIRLSTAEYDGLTARASATRRTLPELMRTLVKSFLRTPRDGGDRS